MEKDLTSIFEGVELTEATLTKMKKMVDDLVSERINSQKEEIEKERQALQEEFLSKDLENEKNILALKIQIEQLQEKAQEYGNHVASSKDAEIAELKQKIEEITEYAQEYGEYIANSNSEEIESLKESAEAYGEYIKNEMQEEIEYITQKANDYSDYVVSEMSTKLESYADYVIEQFIKDHKKDFAQTIELERMKNSFNQIKEAFESNGFTIKESSTELEELEEKLAEKTNAYNSLFADHIKLKEDMFVDNKKSIFESKTRHLADTQKERISKVINNMNFNDISRYETALNIMIEEITTPKTTTTNPITESFVLGENESKKTINNDRVKEYLKYL